MQISARPACDASDQLFADGRRGGGGESQTHTEVNDIGSGESTGCQPFVVDDDADK